MLASYQYFPAANWSTWVGDRLRQQLLSFGFIPYFQSENADLLTVRQQTGSSRGNTRRSHHIREIRNFICGHIKRNDAASRRLIQYLTMETSHLVILVRDAKTGRTLVTPPKDQLWLVREKIGIGRASKNEYNVITQVGPKFFEQMDKHRRWHFGFDNYYDVYVWDLVPGQAFTHLYNRLHETLIKANRFCSIQDYYRLASSILKTLTRDPVTARARTIKPDEKVESIWDIINDPRTAFWGWNIDKEEMSLDAELKTCIYNEADALEDRILFPEEFTGEMKDNLFKEKPSEIVRFERGKPNFDPRRFAYDLDTDEELPESDCEDLSDDDSLGSSCQEQGQLEDGEGMDEDDSMSSDMDMENAMTLFNQ